MAKSFRVPVEKHSASKVRRRGVHHVQLAKCFLAFAERYLAKPLFPEGQYFAFQPCR
jgi:hypothetical protein